VEERDHIAVAVAAAFFAPASVAVIGASKRRGPSAASFRNILAADFNGAARPVNREAGYRQRARVPQIHDPDNVDLP
jgi:acyl-CoA synthetase (NDP forming)